MKRTKEEAEQTKRKLINVALDELIKHGSESITLEGVAAKAGVTRGAIYWHFNNKEDLLDNLIKMKDVDSLELMENILKSDKPPMKKLEQLISENFPRFKTLKEMKHYAKLKLDLYNHYLRYGDNRNIGKAYVKTAASIIKQAQAEGKIKKEINAGDAAYTIFTLIGGLYLRYNQSGSKYKTLQSLLNIVMKYVRQIEK